MKSFIKTFFKSISKFMAYFLVAFLLSFLLKSCDAKASVLPTSVNNLKIAGQNLTTNQDIYVAQGNVNINFSILLDTVFSSDWAKVSMVVCSNGEMSGGIIPSTYNGYIRNIKHVSSQYSCTMVNGATGNVRMLTFDLLFGESGSFDGYFTVYSPSFNLQLIDFVIDSSNYVNLFDYSSDTLISQNSQIINQNTQIINQQQQTNDKLDETNDKLDNIESAITDDTPPDLGALEDSAGWLPAGPVDSILNLPLSLLNNLSNNLSNTCQPVSLPLPYVDENLTLPCLSSVYDEIEGLGSLINTVGVIASAFILFSYLINLYKWVDDTLTLRENNYIDNWGGI